MDRFRTTFTLNDNVHTEKVVAAVQQIIEEGPHQSIQRGCQQMAQSPSTLCKILRASNVQLVQELKPIDQRMRR